LKRPVRACVMHVELWVWFIASPPCVDSIGKCNSLPDIRNE